MNRFQVVLAAALSLVGIVLVSSVTTARLETDLGYGTGGVVTVTLLDEVGAMTVDSAGRTLLVGVKNDTPGIGHVAVARYLPNGAPDTSFDGDGRVDLAASAISFGAATIRVLASDEVVIAGERVGLNTTSQSTARLMLVAQLSTTGVPDASFGSGGLLSIPSALFGLTASTIGPDGTVILTVVEGFGPTGRTHQVVSPTATLSEFESIEQTPAGAGCFDSTLQPRISRFEFVSATELVYAIDPDPPSASCPSGSDYGSFIVRATINSGTVWIKRYLNTYAGASPVVAGSDIVIRLNTTCACPANPTDGLYRLQASDGSPVASWGVNGRVALSLPANVPTDDFIDGSELVALSGGGFSMSAIHQDNDGTVIAAALTTFTPTGALDADTPQVIRQETYATAEAWIAATQDGGVVWGSKFNDEAVILRRFKPDVPATTTTTTTSLPAPSAEPDAETLTPARLLDTRAGSQTVDGLFAGGPRPLAGSVTKVRIAGRGGVPSDASAAIVNLTVILPDGPGFATIYPCTPTPPNASNINFLAGAFVANSVTAKLDANGDACIFTLTGADLLIDVNGYVPEGSDVGTLTPARLLDTRAGSETVDGQSAGGPRPTAGSVTKVRVAGRGGVPSDASAAIVNLTVVLPDGPGFATLYPCTPTPPNASNINFLAGAFVANSVAAKLDANGDVCVFTLTGADLLIDVNAYVGNGSDVGSLTPARLLDTRVGSVTVDGQSAGGPRPTAGSVTKVRVAGRGDVPANATTAIVNLTVVLPDGPGFATVYPCTPTPPNASNINFLAGAFVANGVTAKLDANGDVCIFSLTGADLLIDVSGFVAPSNG